MVGEVMMEFRIRAVGLKIVALATSCEVAAA